MVMLQLPNSRGQNHDRDTYNLQHERDVEFSELRVTLWHDSPGMADNMFLGEVKIPLRGPQQQQFAASNKWCVSFLTLFLAGSGIFSLLCCIHASSGACPSSYPMDNRALSL
jgi:hypothetical protein